MLDACREVNEFSRGLDLEQFIANRRVCLVAERCLEIVGEAAGKVSPQFRDRHPEIQWQKIRGLRNVLAHDYGNIEYEAIHRTVTDDVPPLVAALEAILSAENGVKERGSFYVRKRRRVRVDLNGRLLVRARVVAFSEHKSVSKLVEEGLLLRLRSKGARRAKSGSPTRF
jgi:uncharacterized protein with HEPN domain